ncbi:hypothetical protein MMPV_008381 [Pyropia vietnamensis]
MAPTPAAAAAGREPGAALVAAAAEGEAEAAAERVGVLGSGGDGRRSGNGVANGDGAGDGAAAMSLATGGVVASPVVTKGGRPPPPPPPAVGHVPPTSTPIGRPGLSPVSRAPANVFTHDDPGGRCTRAWTNYFELPVEYTVEMYTDLLNPANPTLAHRHRPFGMPARRFLVVDAAVAALYGPRLSAYFEAHAIPTRTLVLPGEEENKTLPAVHALFEALVDFGLHRREPILAIGGGVVLDIAGFAASMYRRGVPYIRVPTTLLALVDASVGVKTGVDWTDPVHGGLKNRMGAFYPPLAAFLDVGFVATQDERNVINGLGEVMKLALVRSSKLFDLLETHGRALIDSRFGGRPLPLAAAPADCHTTAAGTTNGHVTSSPPSLPPPPLASSAVASTGAPTDIAAVATRVVELSVQTMLEELGPNLWETTLERVVDYGHTFSKILEMNHPTGPTALMHGEAVNIDGVLCVVLAARRGWISAASRDRILRVMAELGLPTWHEGAGVDVLWAGLVDAVEHRGGASGCH